MKPPKMNRPFLSRAFKEKFGFATDNVPPYIGTHFMSKGLNESTDFLAEDRCVTYSKGDTHLTLSEPGACPASATAICKAPLADAAGYRFFGSEVEYELTSTLLAASPEPIPGRTAPIHLQLDKDVNAAERFLDFTLPYRVLLSGIKIETLRDKALKSFKLSYSEQEIQYQGQFREFLFDMDSALDFQVFYRDAAMQASPVLERTFVFPKPVTASRFRLEVVDAGEVVTLAIDLMGEGPKETYAMDPVLEPRVHEHSNN